MSRLSNNSVIIHFSGRDGDSKEMAIQERVIARKTKGWKGRLSKLSSYIKNFIEGRQALK